MCAAGRSVFVSCASQCSLCPFLDDDRKMAIASGDSKHTRRVAEMDFDELESDSRQTCPLLDSIDDLPADASGEVLILPITVSPAARMASPPQGFLDRVASIHPSICGGESSGRGPTPESTGDYLGIPHSPTAVVSTRCHGLSSFDIVDSTSRFTPALACLDPLGRGASGAVRILYNEALGREVARKLIRATSHERAATGLRELELATRAIGASAARRAVSPSSDGVWTNIVEIFEALHDEEDSEFVVTMEVMEGGELGAYFASTPLRLDDENTDDWEERLACVARDVLQGLTTLHDELGFLHRDLKPSNVLLSKSFTAKLADFGVSAPLDDGDLSDQIGSASYMAPERLRGDVYGVKSDVWSLGVTLLQMALGGQHPFIVPIPGRTRTSSDDACFWVMVDVLRATESGPVCDAATHAAVEAALNRVADVRGRRRPASSDFRDFVHHALNADAARRAAVNDLLHHRWLWSAFCDRK
jgi:hypothetical protein